MSGILVHAFYCELHHAYRCKPKHYLSLRYPPMVEKTLPGFGMFYLSMNCCRDFPPAATQGKWKAMTQLANKSNFSSLYTITSLLPKEAVEGNIVSLRTALFLYTLCSNCWVEVVVITEHSQGFLQTVLSSSAWISILLVMLCFSHLLLNSFGLWAPTYYANYPCFL